MQEKQHWAIGWKFKNKEGAWKIDSAIAKNINASHF